MASIQVALDTTPPTVTINSPAAGLVTNENVSVTGVVADNLSGVASLSADVDNGTAVAVSFDASGHFTFTTSLPLDGTKDGLHTVYLIAQDNAGNVSTTHVRLHAQDHPPGPAGLRAGPGIRRPPATTSRRTTRR